MDPASLASDSAGTFASLAPALQRGIGKGGAHSLGTLKAVTYRMSKQTLAVYSALISFLESLTNEGAVKPLLTKTNLFNKSR